MSLKWISVTHQRVGTDERHVSSLMLGGRGDKGLLRIVGNIEHSTLISIDDKASRDLLRQWLDAQEVAT